MSKIYRKRTFTIDGETITKLDELMASNSDKELVDQLPVIYNQLRHAYETTSSLEVSNINVNSGIFDTITVNGTAHINNTEEHDVEGNFVTLRANQNVALANGEYSGIIINHYNSNGDLLVLVTDNTGTLRVGTGTGTNTTYTDLYYANNKYYTDSALTTEVEPSGVMTSWDTYETTDTYEHRTNAVWTTISFTTAEPLLTRDESTNMTDKALIQWDATNQCAVTIAAPTCDEQVLTYDATNCCYEWTDKQAGVYCFATMACYNAYTGNIPEGSIVMIAECNNYITGEDQ